MTAEIKPPKIKETTDDSKTVQVDKTKPAPPFTYLGVKFPGYFKDPRFVQTADKSFTIAIDSADWPVSERAMWNRKYLPELAELTKKVLEKLTKSKIKPL